MSRKITLREEYTLGPWRKFQEFGIIPWGLLCHTLLIICATLQVVVFREIHGIRARSIGDDFVRAIWPDDYAMYNGEEPREAVWVKGGGKSRIYCSFICTGDTAVNPVPRYFIFSTQEVQEQVEATIAAYFLLPWTSVTNVIVPNTTFAAPETSKGLPQASAEARMYSLSASELLSVEDHLPPHIEEKSWKVTSPCVFLRAAKASPCVLNSPFFRVTSLAGTMHFRRVWRTLQTSGSSSFGCTL